MGPGGYYTVALLFKLTMVPFHLVLGPGCLWGYIILLLVTIATKDKYFYLLMQIGFEDKLVGSVVCCFIFTCGWYWGVKSGLDEKIIYL